MTFGITPEELSMSNEEAEHVLKKAIDLYAKQGPEQKKEIQEALDVLLETMSNAYAIVSECQKAIQECLTANICCPLTILRTS
jgi:hypothetical protein